MDGSNAGHYSWASSSSEATTLQGPLTASSTTSPNTAADSTGPQRNLYYGETSGVKPSRSQGAADVSESRRSSDYTQTNASLPEPTTATNAPPPHPRSDPNAKPKEYSIKTCECSPKDSAVPPGRNLVICIDGTSNKCGTVNTNVLELYSQILKDEHDDQLTYYDSGIGTYATPTWKSLSHLMRVIHHKIDLVIAWNLEKVIIGAYQWLSNHYRTGDKIFLFGFSRGAFQVRALAGMIKTVGLLLPGNDSQIPFAYEHYVNYDVPGPDQAGKVKPIAPKFKEMLSRKDVRVHFIGVWDTVSSVGLVRPKNMFPHIVDCCDHVCYFRHALALDERRVKFLPEYVHEGSSHKPEEQPFHGQARCTANIKEVWFAGTHSDDLQLANIPMLWMRNEAIMAGLHLEATDIKWKLTDLEHHTTPPLSTIWKILEHLPIKRLSYKGNQSTSRRFGSCFCFKFASTWASNAEHLIFFRPHRGKSRKIVQGQMIHVSVIFRPGYKPSPAFPNNMGTWPAQLHWDDPDRQERLAELDQIWERDLFNHTAAEDLFERLGRGKQSTARILERIACTTSLSQLHFASLNNHHSHRVILEQR
ncbi:hypothetical protein FIBSPDRAFT_748573 [Athelia psychrophila]|uniref:T6SS Phospholipase effector Tle1-like catalytic domain-containing protein n=1 Tax=Athelia psychrophila TaxID=1759441 RepID=A0A166F6P0_9AGAM|nr:hypothetical protein FIBSPDRAFT_748573 [Fibularhizoctonia sp. CBS 109695]